MNRYRWAIVVVFVLVFGFLYWFGFRPEEIRKGCFNEASKSAIEDTNSPLYQGNQDRITRMQLQDQLTENAYLDCVRGNGLAN